MRRTSITLLATLLAGALLVAGCATESTRDLGLSLDRPELRTSDQTVDAALDDVNAFWQRTYEDLYGAPYEPISGGFWPYGPTTEQPPCGRPSPSYEDIAGNAFYCPESDLIAWDDVNLVPGLYDEFGPFTLGIVFAHEFGHAIQQRSGTLDASIRSELQADCFAGAWTADVDAGNAEHFEIDAEDLDRAVAGFLALRDSVGIDPSEPAAHGTGFDRIGAFAEGFEQGAERCAEYPDEFAAGDRVIVEVPFTDQADFDRGGNLPLSELGPVLLADLENFWSLYFDGLGETWTPVADVVTVDPASDEVECGDATFREQDLVHTSFYCRDTDTIYIDGSTLIPELESIGDYAVATEIARQYAFAAQARLGDLDNSAASDLQADCLVGVYAHSGFVGDREGQGQELFLSPGDLDEAIITFLRDNAAQPDSDDAEASVTSVFERFDAYRAGFLDGARACEAMLDSA